MKKSIFFILILLTPILVKAHYGPKYSPDTERSLGLFSLNSNAVTNYNPYDYVDQDSSGTPSRWMHSDNGSRIKFYIDIEDKPNSFSSNDIRFAAIEAFDAWSNICSVSFIFGGFIRTYSAPSDFFENNTNYHDSIIIQMHDIYKSRDNDNWLAAGGAFRTTGELLGKGGKLNGIEFNKLQEGFIYFNHSHEYWQDASYENLVQVFKHEIGHVLGLRHSNYDPITGEEVHMPALTTDNSYKRQSIMYYQVTESNTTFNQWDLDHIKLLYDKENHVPFSNSIYDNEALYYPYDSYYFENNINFFTLDAGDLDGDPTTIVEVQDEGYYNNFVSNYFDGQTIEMRVPYNFTSGEWITSSDYHRFAYRIMDSNQNLSPIYYIKIKKFISDYNYNGISDEWENAYGINPDSRSYDSDNDRISDYEEYITYTDPTDSNSYNQIYRELNLAKNGIIENPMQYNLYDANQLADMRLGSQMVSVSNGQALLRFGLDMSDDLTATWQTNAYEIEVEIPATNDVQFFRLRMD